MVETLQECICLMREEIQDKYCKAYIDSLPECVEEGMDGLVTQMSYILSNARSWRGDTANEVKSFIRNWIKEKRGSETY